MMNIASEPVACRRQSEVFPGFKKERVPTELERASKPTSSSVTVRVRPVQVGNKVQFDWVAADTEYNRDRCSRRFGHGTPGPQGETITATSLPNQLGSKRRFTAGVRRFVHVINKDGVLGTQRLWAYPSSDADDHQ
jgi:hypothetical protein